MMEVAELIERTRSDVLRDVPAPQLFSEDSMVSYANEAYRLFVRTTHAFVDTISLDTVAGTDRYELGEDTIFVRGVVNAFGQSLGSYTRKSKPGAFNGKPTHYTTDGRHKTIRFWPNPDDVYELQIERAYLPALVTIDDVIELDYDYALLLADRIAYLCLRNNDPDGSETIDADQFQVSWLAGLRNAKMEYTRMAMGDHTSVQPRRWT